MRPAGRISCDLGMVVTPRWPIAADGCPNISTCKTYWQNLVHNSAGKL